MKKQQAQKGQIMILTTLILSGTILAAVTIAGLLMLYQIRQAGNAVQSGRAIFVADGGLEYELYKFYSADCDYVKPTFAIGPVQFFTKTEVRVTDPAAVPPKSDVLFTSNALAGKTNRNLTLRFAGLGADEHCVSGTATP